MRANFQSMPYFALFCYSILLASGHPISPVDSPLAPPWNSVPCLVSSARRSILPRYNNTTTPSGENGESRDRNDLLRANLTAAIAVAAGLGVLLILVGLMSAFRMGWSRGLEHQKEARELASEGSGDAATDPTFVPWQGEPPIIRGMSENDLNSPYMVVGGLGRHSFRPGKGVYEIRDGPIQGRIKSIVRADKDKTKSIDNW